MTWDIFSITPVVLYDNDGFWLASHNPITGELSLAGYYFRDSYPEENAAHQVITFLQASGMDCQGFWEGYIGDAVCDRWNSELDLQDKEGDPIAEAETKALELIIAEKNNFLEEYCEFVAWPPEDSI
jgi:hypothetical protein